MLQKNLRCRYKQRHGMWYISPRACKFQTDADRAAAALAAQVLSLFASVIAPFGGFFASGFKRGFKIKDFGNSIPGHGGMTDRMDCQVRARRWICGVNKCAQVSIWALLPCGHFECRLLTSLWQAHIQTCTKTRAQLPTHKNVLEFVL